MNAPSPISQMTPAEGLAEAERRRAAGVGQVRHATSSSHVLGGFTVPLIELPQPKALRRTQDAAREITVLLPWSMLVPDNERMAPAMRGKRAALVMALEYRNAKKRAAALARTQVSIAPFTGPVKLVARLIEPNNHRRDLTNYVKLVHDALTGVAFLDDSQIVEAHWIKQGVNIDAPGLDIRITAALR